MEKDKAFFDHVLKDLFDRGLSLTEGPTAAIRHDDPSPQSQLTPLGTDFLRFIAEPSPDA